MASSFLQQVADYMRTRRYAKRTIETYLHWIKFFILFHKKQHPSQLSNAEVEQFLTWLAVERHVAFKTQSSALNALVFLYREFLQQPLSLQLNFNAAKTPPKLPVVLTRAEVGALLRWIDPKYKLVAQLLYGSGLRLMEAVRLRVKDIDFDYLSVMVWQGKGNKNRRVTLASELVPALRQQIILAERLLDADLQNPVYGGVWLPYALALKNPAAPRQLGWHYLFPSNQLSRDPESKLIRRHHLDETCVRKAIKFAAFQAKIGKNVTCHTLRHSFRNYIPVVSPAGQPAAVQIHSR